MKQITSLVTKNFVNHRFLIRLQDSASALEMMRPRVIYRLAAKSGGATRRRRVVTT